MGKAFCFGDNIDTDVIIPGQYLNVSDSEELAKSCMNGYEEGFIKKITPGDVFVAGNNFGCGSSREHAAISIKSAGVACIIAKSFARIFYRNAINIGLPVLESPEAVAAIEQGNEISVDFSDGVINNLTKGEIYLFTSFPASILEIIKIGGAVEYVKSRRLQTEGNKCF